MLTACDYLTVLTSIVVKKEEESSGSLLAALEDPEIIYVNIWNNVGGELQLQEQKPMLKSEFDDMQRKKDFSRLAQGKKKKLYGYTSRVQNKEEIRSVGGVGNPSLARVVNKKGQSEFFRPATANSKGIDGVKLNLPVSLEHILTNADPTKASVPVPWDPKQAAESDLLPGVLNRQIDPPPYVSSRINAAYHSDYSNTDYLDQRDYNSNRDGGQHYKQTIYSPPMTQIKRPSVVVEKSSPGGGGGQGLSPPSEIAQWIMRNQGPAPVVLESKPSAFKSPTLVKVPSTLEIYGNYRNKNRKKESKPSQLAVVSQSSKFPLSKPSTSNPYPIYGGLYPKYAGPSTPEKPSPTVEQPLSNLNLPTRQNEKEVENLKKENKILNRILENLFNKDTSKITSTLPYPLSLTQKTGVEVVPLKRLSNRFLINAPTSTPPPSVPSLEENPVLKRLGYV